ncbi:MAG: hypothetical protein ABIK44_03970 [candidate division WOR-3 bacterium]
MLVRLPKFQSLDPLIDIMANYGYTDIHADPPAQKLLGNSGLLKTFYDNAFTNKLSLKQNFRTTFGHLEFYLAHDPALKTAWFVADPNNKLALVNYYRDALSLDLKASGILLTGSTTRLTPVGWQNLHDLLTDQFLKAHPEITRIEVLGTTAGVRWRPPSLGIGLTLLNIKELAEIHETVAAALRGEGGADIQN